MREKIEAAIKLLREAHDDAVKAHDAARARETAVEFGGAEWRPFMLERMEAAERAGAVATLERTASKLLERI